jgi:tetratricopeptide (TPR) repeat protein
VPTCERANRKSTNEGAEDRGGTPSSGVYQIARTYRRTCGTYLWWGDTREGKGEALFPLPGSYLLRARLTSEDKDKTSEIGSNVLTIRVEEPTGQDLSAWEYLKTDVLEAPADRPFFFWASGDKERALRAARLEWFARHFPESQYAVYAWYAIGIAEYGEKNPDKAGPALEEVIKRKDFPLRDQALYYLMKICLKKGNIEKAEGHLAELEREYPDSRFTPIARYEVINAKSRS